MWLEGTVVVVGVWRGARGVAGVASVAGVAGGADEADLGDSRAARFVLSEGGERVTRLRGGARFPGLDVTGAAVGKRRTGLVDEGRDGRESITF